MLPYLSIIIPVYKVEPYLRECLDSVAASSQDCWEVILIDDGSLDGCPQICDEYAARDRRFRVIHQENAGVATARNVGLDAAKGEWIWFVDSDDVVDMRPVGAMIAWLNEHRGTDLVMFDLKTFNDERMAELYKDKNKDTKDLVRQQINECCNKNEFLMRHICFHHQRLWYKKELLDQYAIRFTKGVRLAEDLELQYKYLTICQHPVKSNTVLYYYRVREGSATQERTYRIKAIEDLQIVINNFAEWIRKNGIEPEPWIDLRIKMLFQNLLYSASQVKDLNILAFQTQVQVIISKYHELDFPFVNKLKYRLVKRNVRAYFLLNRFYLKYMIL